MIRPLSDLLRKYSTLKSSQDEAKICIAGVIEELCGVTLDTQSLSLVHKTLFISASPLTKQVIFKKKAEILAILQEKLLDKAPTLLR